MKTKSVSRRISKMSGGSQQAPRSVNLNGIPSLNPQQPQPSQPRTVSPTSVPNVPNTCDDYDKFKRLINPDSDEEIKTKFGVRDEINKTATDLLPAHIASQLKTACDQFKTNYSYFTSSGGDDKHKFNHDYQTEKTLIVAIKEDKINHTNIFHKEKISIKITDNLQITIPVLLRSVKTKRFPLSTSTDKEIKLHGIYLMGFDTDIRTCHKSENCHIIQDLYKLSDDCTKLNKTDMKIFRHSSNEEKVPDSDNASPAYRGIIREFKSYIVSSKTNIFTLFILLTLPTDHNILKIFGKDVLMGLKSVPMAVGKTLFVGTGAVVGVAAGALVGIGTGITDGFSAGVKAGVATTNNAVKSVTKAVSGGKKRTKKKTQINKSRRSLRRSRK
jgi:hypothetical protein